MFPSTSTWSFSQEAYSKNLSLLSRAECRLFTPRHAGVWSVWAWPWVGQESIPQSLGHVQQFPNPTVDPLSSTVNALWSTELWFSPVLEELVELGRSKGASERWSRRKNDRTEFYTVQRTAWKRRCLSRKLKCTAVDVECVVLHRDWGFTLGEKCLVARLFDIKLNACQIVH